MAEQNHTSNTPSREPSPNLKTAEAARFLNVQPSTLEQWRWNGRGPRFVKLNRAVIYRRADLEAFLAERVFSSTTEARVGGNHE